MLNALLSLPLFLVISLACHLLFQYTCWVRHVLTLAITTSSRARSVWGVLRGYSELLGIHFPQSATWGVGVSAARINANWNAYLFIFMTFGLVCNKFNFGTLWHFYRYLLLSSYVCNFDSRVYMIICSVLFLQNWTWHYTYNVQLYSTQVHCKIKLK